MAAVQTNRVEESLGAETRTQGRLVSWVDKACQLFLNSHFSRENNVFFLPLFDRKLALVWASIKEKRYTLKNKLTGYGVFYELSVSVSVALGASVVLHSFWVAWPATRVIPYLYAGVLWWIYEVHLLCQKDSDFTTHVKQRLEGIKKSFVKFSCEASDKDAEGKTIVCKQRVSPGVKISVVAAVLFFFHTPFRWLFLSISALPLLGALEIGFIAAVCLNCIQQITGTYLIGGGGSQSVPAPEEPAENSPDS